MRADPGEGMGLGGGHTVALNQPGVLGWVATPPSLKHKLCESLRPGCADPREVPAGSLGIMLSKEHVHVLRAPGSLGCKGEPTSPS